ncbi:MAG TPA: PAC2 family protein [Acidimicrobiales bacterium]|nr:PAC2 family protein [Acidimicrobiales bacterium]
MDYVRWQDHPQLRRPVLIAAFEGWNDAGDAASAAVRYLRDQWSARPFATIDHEDFYDFTSTRPQVRLVDGITRRIEWPDIEFSWAALPGTSRDVVVMLGHEPQLKWRTFTEQVVALAKDLKVELIVILGALLADVAHTRPVRVTGTAADAELVRRLNLGRSAYEGPTGIVGVLHDAFSKAHLPSASLWASVPHYVASTPSPKASLALVERAADLLSTKVDITELRTTAADYERQVSEVVAADDDVTAYVQRLESSADEDDAVADMEMVSGDALAAELERFLREEHGD